MRDRIARTALVVLLAAAAAAFWWLPPRPLFREPVSTVLLARDGSLLGARIAADGQWRFPDLDSVPPRFAAALVAYEDRRYFEHGGVDLRAVVRAARDNLQAGRVVSGASTLSMQLARLIRNQGNERAVPRTFAGKAYEALLAVRLELAWSKDELLALYASHAPFGGNVVGLETAAWRYFGRSPEALSWAEAATLAVLPNSPALVTPGRNRERLLEKRNELLRRLASDGELGALDLALALAEPLVAAPLALPDDAPHLLETLRRRFPDQHRFHSTLDAELQRQAMEAVREHSDTLRRGGIGNAAAVVVDNRDLELLAYVGNSQWQTHGERALAVDVVQRPRSTGSILKPFLYAAMLDSGQLSPQMLVADVPTQFRGFAPENFDRTYRGAVPADEALAQSLNVPAVRLLREYGYPRFYDLLQALGFSTLHEPPDHYGLALVLGGAEATLWDVTRAYANLADRARPAEGSAARGFRDIRVLKPAGGADPATAVSTPQPLTIGAAWLTQQALLQVARPAEEASWKSFASSRAIAWKTGTSWGLRDGWAVGSSTRYTVGVWAGNADGTGVPGLTGSAAAAPLMFALHNRLPASDWYREPVGALQRIAVCADDHYLADGECPERETWVPAGSHFARPSPYHRRVHLDAAGEYRVDASCERLAAMRHESWFVLPATMEHYYRRHHPGYRPLPPVRGDCASAAVDASAPMELVYPGAAGKIYVPVDLDGRSSRAVFEVVHRDSAAEIFWHLDDAFAARTVGVHQLTVDLPPGVHRVTVVDESGIRLARTFEILAKRGPTGPSP